jgi:two-component sensor histidine kinase
MVSVEWTIDQHDIRLLWREAGGPITTRPSRTAYGTRLVEATIQGLGGCIDYKWRRNGLATRVRIPLSSLDA